MAKFPADVPVKKVIGTLEQPGFRLIREGNYIAMLRGNADGIRTPLTIPNHPVLKNRFYERFLISPKSHETIF